jgi:AraC-like DNA-binding protein
MESMNLLARPDSERHNPNGIVHDVQAQIRTQLAEGEPNLERVSEQLHLTSWTLQRRLGDSGLSFSQLVDKVRRELAQQYLSQAHLPISELALLLGYSEASAFSRAFRRWYGVSPKQWRVAE